jgi:hypothetical protein
LVRKTGISNLENRNIQFEKSDHPFFPDIAY